MRLSLRGLIPAIFLMVLLALPGFGTNGRASWSGVLRDSAGNVVPEAAVELHHSSGAAGYSARTSATGAFAFSEIAAGKYELSVSTGVGSFKASTAIDVNDGAKLPPG